jgi:hypothetical protein
MGLFQGSWEKRFVAGIAFFDRLCRVGETGARSRFRGVQMRQHVGILSLTGDGRIELAVGQTWLNRIVVSLHKSRRAGHLCCFTNVFQCEDSTVLRLGRAFLNTRRTYLGSART